MGTTQEHKAVVAQYVECFNAGQWDLIRGLFSEDAVIQGVLGWGPMVVALPIWRDLHDCLRANLTVEAMVAEGDLVAVRYVERGTSVAEFRGKPATGKSYEVAAMEFFEFKGGKIFRRWGARDYASISRQLGFA